MAVSVIKNTDYEVSELQDAMTLTTGVKILDEQIAVSGSTSWQRGNWTVDLTGYKQVVLTVGVHGALENSVVADVELVNHTTSTTQLHITAYWNSDNLIGAAILKESGEIHVSASAKTSSMPADITLIAYK